MEIDTNYDSYSVRWENHKHTLKSIVENLCNDEMYADCYLVGADGIEVPAHRIILASASPLLDTLLRKKRLQQPVLMMTHVKHHDLIAILQYIYKGTVEIDHTQLRSFLAVARELRVSGLDVLDEDDEPAPERKTTERTLILKEPSQEQPIVLAMPPNDKDENDEMENLMDEDIDEQVIEYLQETEEEASESSEWFESADHSEENNSAMLNQTSVKFKPIRIAPCSITPRSVQKPRARDKKIVDEHSLKCSECLTTYKNEATFINHLRHDCKQTHTCSECQKTFKNKRHLLDHLRDDCGRTHKCPGCGREFQQKVNLTTHMKNYCKPKPKAARPTKPATASPGRLTGFSFIRKAVIGEMGQSKARVFIDEMNPPNSTI